MGEFKSGTLKSGGSGKKVTNPKQAIAIALSEANAMNQGGMMQNPVMQRPMFQNPMQRQGLGIMAGVAPVQGYENGGSVQEEEDLLDQVKGQFEKTPEGSGMNLRDLTDFFIVDPEDEYDVAMAAATAGLMGFPPAAAAAALTRMGYKGKKLYDKVNKLKQLQDNIAKPSEGAGLTKTVTKPIGSVMAAREIEDAVEDPTQFVEDYYEIGQDAAETGKLLYDNRELLGEMALEELKDSEVLQQQNMIGPFSDFRGMADGGIASIPVYMDDGGEAKKTKKKSKKGLGIQALKDKLKDLVNKGKIEIEDAEEVLGTTTKTKPRVRVDASGQVVDFDKPTITRRQEAAARRKADSEKKPPPESPKQPESTTKPKDADKPKDDQEKQATETSTATSDKDVSASQQAADDIVFDNKKRGNIITRNPKKAGLIFTSPITAPIAAGIVDEFAGTDIATPTREARGDAVDFVTEGLGRIAEGGYRGSTGEELGGEPTPPTMPQNPGINYSNLTRPPAPPASAQPNVAAVAGTQAQEEEQERRKVMPGFRPFGGTIARALLGEDEAFGGDRGAIDFMRSGDPEGRSFMDNVMSTLSDPRTRYQLSQAAKATEGFVPRNFATDMEEAGQAYDDMVAQRDYLKAQTRDVDRTDTEKLIDYYIDSLKEADPNMSDEEASNKRLKLNSLFQRQGASAAQMETILTIFDNVPNAETAQAIFDKLNIDPSLPNAVSQILAGDD